MRRVRAIWELAGDRSGFTLVEVMVAMMILLVIITVTLGVLNITLRLTSRVADQVESTQRGRGAMERIVQELHSSCLAFSVTPIWTNTNGLNSDASNMLFVSQYGPGAVLTPSLHKISFTAGALTDSVYASTGGSAPNWTFASTPTTTTTLLTKVSQASLGSPGVLTPVFQYYSYVNSQLSTTALPTPLSVSDAASVAEVTISFATSPVSGSIAADRAIGITDSVVLRFSPASATSTKPCA